MLRNMFVGVPEGNHDRILDFSTAVTGGLFFAPTVDFLEDPTAPTAHPTDASDLSEPDDSSFPSDDGSLGIGSLKDSDL
jgi:putative iron-dependent peroxidase